MKKIFLIAIFGFLLLFGCMEMKTEDDCNNLNEDDLIGQTSWGENVVSTDSAIVTKAKVTCWHTAALGYAAKSDPDNAADSCEQIKQASVNPSDFDMLGREYVMCIDSVAKRMRNPSLCEKIDEDDFEFEKKRCLEHATPPPTVCSSTTFVLLALGGSIFIFTQRKK